tara:strand:- start:199 stop:348 length:150 start_codon:yes stop_codon:yes gene_type:complete
VRRNGMTSTIEPNLSDVDSGLACFIGVEPLDSTIGGTRCPPDITSDYAN